MYLDGMINGTSLPEGTLCLTFDDGPGETSGPGPGPRTLELAQYLNDQGVPVTFFVVGKFASDLPHILSHVESLGHLIGNHSYDHPNLVQYAALGGDVVGQIARTDGLILNWIDGPVVFVRPPYGAWSADLARSLNADMTASLSHIGPIGWEIDRGDYVCWQDNRDPQTCAADYLQQIEEQRRGIVLLHDCTADQEAVKRANRTFELVQVLIPALRQRGFQFARLDAVPAITAITAGNQSAPRVALRGSNGLFVSAQDGGGGAITVNAPSVGLWEVLVVEDLDVGKVALRAMNGQYVSPQNGGGGDVLANGPSVGDWEPLELISLADHQVAFRTMTGHFLSCESPAGATLNCKGAPLSIQPSNVFTYEYLS